MPDTQITTRAKIIADLRAELARHGLDAFILPRFDAHQGEYVAPHDERLAYVTGFTGSAGMAIVTPDTVAVFVDGRYTVQLGNQCAGPLFSHQHILETLPENWLGEAAQAGWQVGFDPMHIPPRWFDRFEKVAAKTGFTLQPLWSNPVDAIWEDQPAPPRGAITPFPSQFSGRSAEDKLDFLATKISESGATFQMETQPDNIAWLLNVRGGDVAFNPMPQSFLLVGQDGAATWYVDPVKVDADVRDTLPETVTIAEPSEFLKHAAGQVKPDDVVLTDPDFSPVAVRLAMTGAGATPKECADAVTLAKAIKNASELEGMRACHIQDGVAWTEFSAWLAREVPARAQKGQPLTEREVEEQMFAFRQARSAFLENSFNPISAASGNAAMCHYATELDNAVPVLPENPYLLDSGGQYETGTTDATRSFSFGQRPDGYDQAYTAVYKAFHALVTLRFPRGTQGHHIDAICRRPLWDLGLDYDHGTGHGIGHRLSVHEHPQRIGKPYNPVDLVPGMVMSIEPGFYLAEKFGIRIENLFEIVEEEDGFLSFSNMTWAPIQTEMLDLEKLSDDEKLWLNAYHAELLGRLGALLSEDTRAWALKACAPI